MNIDKTNYPVPLPTEMKTLEDLKYHSAINPNLWGSSPKYLDSYEIKVSIDTVPEWNYEINNIGYRGNWEINASKSKIGFYGCSFTFGVGVDAPYTFAEKTSEILGSSNYTSINLGIGGSSIQRTAKIFSASIKFIDFDYVVFNLPSMSRALMSDSNGRLSNFIPNWPIPDMEKQHARYYKLFNDWDFKYNSVDFISWILAEIKNTSIINALWTSWDAQTYSLLSQMIPEKNLLPIFVTTDNARDQAHPGIVSHNTFAHAIAAKIKSYEQ